MSVSIRRQVFITLLTAVLLVVLLLSLRFLDSRTDTLFSFQESDIVSLSFPSSDGSGNLSFRRENDTWICEEYPDLALNQNRLSNMCSRIAELSGAQPIRSKDEAAYGINASSKTINVTTSSEKIQIRIGNHNVSTGLTYVKIGSAPLVYTVDTTFMNLFTATVFDITERRHIADLPSDQVTGFRIEKPTGTVSFTRGDNFWSVSEDGRSIPSPDAISVESTLASLLRLTADRMIVYHPEPADLAAYGLSDPGYLIVIETADDSLTLSISSQTGEEDSYCVYTSGSTGIEAVDSLELSSLLRVSAGQFQSLAISPPKPAEIVSLTVTYEGSSHFVKPETPGNAEKWIVDGHPADLKAFNSFYFCLYALSGDKLVSDLSEQQDEADLLALDYELGMGSPIHISFFPFDNSYCGVNINGFSTMLIAKAKVDKLLDLLLPLLSP